MSAGQPNYQKLLEMGKLPQNQRWRIPGLALVEDLEKKLKDIEEGVCDSCRKKFFDKKKEKKDEVVFKEKCQITGCDYVAEGKSEAIAKNNLRLHMKSHDREKVQ